MNPALASVVCAGVIAGLYYLDREKAPRISNAVWIPGIWLGIVGSRGVSTWLGVSVSGNEMGSEGSPIDAAVFALLLAIAIGVMIRRHSRVRGFLRANWPLVAYFSICFISIAWSGHPDIALKRWIKAIGDFTIALVLVTEHEPLVALRRLMSRLGILIFPISLLFIRYFSDLGRSYDADGFEMNIGVTTHKNMLGLIVMIISLVTYWNIRSLIADKEAPGRRRRLFAQCILLAFGMMLFWMANCSTAKVCFLLGTVVITALNLRIIKRRRIRVHGLCLMLVIAAAASFFVGGQSDVAGALGRQSNLSGRTDIWAALTSASPNTWIGSGFESFWSSPYADIAKATLMSWGYSPGVMKGLNEGHDGYVEIYLQLGWIGICLIALISLSAYRRACSAYRLNSELGALLVACVLVEPVYAITEAAFRTLSPSWVFFLIAVVYASGINAGLFGCESRVTSATRGSTISSDDSPELVSGPKPAQAFQSGTG